MYSFSSFCTVLVIWSVYGECENLGVLTGHSGAVLDMKFSTDGSLIYTSSTDMTVSFWDIYKGQRVKKLKGILIRLYYFSIGSN